MCASELTPKITQEYFENYAGRSLPYSKVWKDHSYYDECCKLFKRRGAPPIKSICVLGASSGQVLKEFHKRLGVKPHGCEINEWAHKQIAPEYKRRVHCEDMMTYVSRALKSKKHFDLAFANSLIYLPEQKLPAFINKLSRFCTYLHFKSSFQENYCPDDFRCTLKPYKWWNEVFCDNGFKRFVWGRSRTYCWMSL